MCKQKISTLAITLATAVVAWFSGTARGADGVGEAAPDFTLKTTDGKSLTLSDLKGKRGAVLVFFATWCPGCMEEAPVVKKFVDSVRDKNVLVYGINLRQDADKVEKFVKEYGINYRILMDTDAAVATKYNVTGIPLVVGVDSEGVVRYRDNGLPQDWSGLAASLTEKLPKAAETAPQEGKDMVKDGVSYISKETLQKLLAEEKNLTVVDVLSPESYHAEHVKDSINIPLEQLTSLQGKLPKDGKIVVYCANYKCHASTEAAKKLAELGFKDVHDYKGGIEEWSKAGLPTEKGESKLNFISKDDLQKLLAGGGKATLVDVLSPESFAKSHLAGAINIPLGEIEKRAAELDKNATIVTYCANYVCQASSAAAEKLLKLGFTDVRDYKGGLHEWQEAGLPVAGGGK